MARRHLLAEIVGGGIAKRVLHDLVHQPSLLAVRVGDHNDLRLVIANDEADTKWPTHGIASTGLVPPTLGCLLIAEP